MQKMKGMKILVAACFMAFGISSADSFKDSRDGKVYKTVKIGNQTWLAQNLNFKAVGSVCNLDGKANTKCENGRFYTQDVALRACPAGWRLPSLEDLQKFQDLIYANSKEENASHVGTLMKSKTGWKHKEGVPDGTDAYGFNSYPAGVIMGTTEIVSIGEVSDYWSSSDMKDDSKHAVTWGFYWEDEKFGIWESDKKMCYHTVRCIKE